MNTTANGQTAAQVNEIKRYPTVTNPIKADDLHTPQAYAYSLRRAIVTDCNQEQRAALVDLLDGKDTAEGVTFNNTKVNRSRLHIWQNEQSRKERAAILGDSWQYGGDLETPQAKVGDAICAVDGTTGICTQSYPSSCVIEFRSDKDGKLLSVCGYFFRPANYSGCGTSEQAREFADHERVIVSGFPRAKYGKECGTVYAYNSETGKYWIIFRDGHGNGNSWHKAERLAHVPEWIKDGAQVNSVTGWRTGQPFTISNAAAEVVTMTTTDGFKFRADLVELINEFAPRA